MLKVVRESRRKLEQARKVECRKQGERPEERTTLMLSKADHSNWQCRQVQTSAG